MKYITEFRQAPLVSGLVEAIRHHALPMRIMEVCGGHTHVICKYGLASLLPPQIQLVHGPGCPVCIIPSSTLSTAILLSTTPGVTVACFGDVMKVPTPRGTLLSRARGSGGSVRMVYSPLEALELARANPSERVVFLAIGFETTAPSTAIAMRRARADGIGNFLVLSAHYLVPPALRALMADPMTRVDAFIAPGHVSTVIGARAYQFLVTDYRCPVVVSGFEPLDVLHAILMILEEAARGDGVVGNEYRRAVGHAGNQIALDAMAEVFSVTDATWRGLGVIPSSGLAVSEAFGDWDARRVLPIEQVEGEDDAPGCRCGEVLRGLILPPGCSLFGTGCTPESPVGPCMVSPEGACAAHFRYAGQ